MTRKTELMVQVTYACNLNCIHCAYGDIKSSPYRLTWGRVSSFLSKYDPQLIKISGGEPTIDKNYSHILHTCKHYDAKVITFTNGLGKPKEHPDTYWVSLYGEKKIHNSITRQNTWTKTMEFIKNHEVEYLNSPIFSRSQMKSLLEISRQLDIPLRVTRLLPHGSATKVLRLKRQQKIVRGLKLNRKPHWVTCSLGFEPSRCWKKKCLKPDGSEVTCTAVIRGLECPFRKKYPQLLWPELFDQGEYQF